MAPVCDLPATALVGTRRDLASEISYLLELLVGSPGMPAGMPGPGMPDSPATALAGVRRELASEISYLLAVLVCPGHYEQREILTAVGWLTSTKRTPFQAGVLPLKDRKLELLMVTLDKSTGFHAGISYHDYAISPTQFHWQSQNSAGPTTMVGKRYLESPSNGWSFQLFVRIDQSHPFVAYGPIRLVHAMGERPMSIVWELECPLPARVFQQFSVLRA